MRVTAGRDRGKTGRVTAVFPRKGLVTVAGVNMVVRHTSGRQNVRQAGKISKEMPLNLSSVMLIDPDTNKVGRVAWKFLKDGTKIRTIKDAKTS